MKGLFVKDLYIMLQNRIFLVLSAILIIGLFLIPGGSMYYVVPYISFLLVTDMLGTISYDEADHGFKALFVMPFTRKQYVQEKYVLVLGAGIVIPFVLCLLFILLGRMSAAELAMLALIMLALTVFMGALAIPCYLKFGMEKGKLVNVAVIMIAIMIITSLSDPQILLEHQSVLSDPLVLWTAAAVLLLVLGVSYEVSLRVMKNKEF